MAQINHSYSFICKLFSMGPYHSKPTMAKRLFIAILLCILLAAESFVMQRQSKASTSKCPTRRCQKSSAFGMHLDGIDSHLDPLLSLSMPQSNILSSAYQLASDPVLEAELLNDVSHVVLDFTTFVSPNTAWIR